MELFSIRIQRTFQLVSTPVLKWFDYDNEMVVKKRTWKFDSEDEEMVCILKVAFLCFEE